MSQAQTITTYNDINWQLLWRNSREAKSWKSKNAKEWNKKSTSFAQRTKHSSYVEQFLNIIEVDRNTTLLDVGCGPGTLAVPYARMVARVTAIDYSEGMLGQLKDFANEERVENIKVLKCAWEDDWEKKGVGSHDLIIASRSMNIGNLAEGIEKLDRHALKRVVIADRIAPSPFDPDAFAAIGRTFNSGPDYIYTLNMLYGLGIHPRIDHIELPSELRFSDFDEAVASYSWMFRDLNEKEEHRLKKFLESRLLKYDGSGVVVKRNHPQRWAVLSWTKQS